MKINVTTIAHTEHVYPTIGWWHFEEDGTLTVKVSKLSSWKYESLIVIHEIVEALLCRSHGVPEDDINAFDVAFEDRRIPGNYDEPGDDPEAPYRSEHAIATLVERLCAFAMGVDWKTYEGEVNSMT